MTEHLVTTKCIVWSIHIYQTRQFNEFLLLCVMKKPHVLFPTYICQLIRKTSQLFKYGVLKSTVV